MKPRLAAFVMAIAAALPAVGAEVPGWKAATSELGEFSIAMPEEPTEQVKSVDSPDGPVDLNYLVARHADSIYMVMFADFLTIPGGQPARALDVARNNLAATARGRLTSDRPVALGNVPGKEVRIDVPATATRAGAVYRARIFLADHRLYQVRVIEPADRARTSTKDVTAFLDSFKLIRKPATTTEAVKLDLLPFASDDGGFSLLMPGSPTEEKQSTTSGGKALEFTLFPVDRGASTFAASFVDYPEIAREAPTKIIDGARNGAVSSMQGRLVSERVIDLKGHPGKEFVVAVPESKKRGEFVYKARIYLVGTRLYQVFAILPKAEVASKDVIRYFNSFKLSEDRAMTPTVVAPQPRTSR